MLSCHLAESKYRFRFLKTKIGKKFCEKINLKKIKLLFHLSKHKNVFFFPLLSGAILAFVDPDLDCESESTDAIEFGSNQVSEPKNGSLGCVG
jgi:hypothetical protein